MARFSFSVILIIAISNVFQPGLVVGMNHSALARPSERSLALREGSVGSPEELTVSKPSQHHVPSVGIQDSKTLNKTCCLNGGTCILGSFCACPPSFYGRNCEHSTLKQHCGSVPHGTWLPKKCSLCRCWHGQIHCFNQPFLKDCGTRMVNDHFLASKSSDPAPLAWAIFLLSPVCVCKVINN
ncbi:protein Cripto [Thomomys bottae]